MKTKKIKKAKHRESIKKNLMFFHNQLNKKIEYVFLFAVILISVFLGIYYVYNQFSKNGYFSFPLDDPWIHLTFAKNFLEYGAYSYFKDEVITSGSTSPLYTFIAAFLFLVFKNEFILSYFLGVFFFGLLTFVSFKLAQVEIFYSISALIFALLVALQPKLGLISVSGMETTMFIAFCLITVYFYRKEKFMLAGVFGGLTVWTRPEGIILVFTIFVDSFVQKLFYKTRFAQEFFDKKKYLQFALSLVIIIILYFIFNYSLSGSLFPNTYKAKIAYYFGSDRSRFLKNAVFDYFTEGEFLLVAFLFVFAFIFLVIDTFRKNYNPSFLYFLFIVMFILIYYIELPFSHRFGRYLMPLIPFYLFVAYNGLHQIVFYLYNKSKTDQSGGLNFVFVLVTGFTLLISISKIPENAEELTITGKYHYDRHIKIAEWLKQNTNESDIIATHDIGAIAFYSKRKVVDMVGLINPEISEYLKDKRSTEFLKEHLLKNKVTYFATMRNWFEAVNQRPIYLPINEFEFFEVYKFIPERFHIMPNEASFYNQRALLLMQNQNYRAALDYLMRSLRIDPKSSRTLFLIGNAYDFLKDYSNAERYLIRAIELFPEYYEARYELARVYYHQKKFDLAKQEISRTLELKPDFKEAIELMINLSENIDKNNEEAAKYREILRKLN